MKIENNWIDKVKIEFYQKASLYLTLLEFAACTKGKFPHSTIFALSL